MEVESWLKEQDTEYTNKLITHVEENIMKLDIRGTSEGRTAVIEEHDLLEDLNITMKEDDYCAG